MYSDLIKDLLKKHFGEPRSSLTIGDAEESDDKMYFYSLKKEKEITAIRDLLGMKQLVDGIEKLPELRQTIPDKGEDGLEIPQCVSFRESDGNWCAYFHKITGVHYHRTYGNKVAATLQNDDYPFVMLSDRDDEFYGSWRKMRTRKRMPYKDRDGLSYWMNKALRTNERFRAFTVDFFFSVAEAEHLYILKDVARTISNCGCFLPPFSFQNLLTFRTPAEMIHSLQKEHTDLNIDFNKVDINVGYVMSAPEVDKRDWKLISKFDAEKASNAISLNLFYDGFSAEEFVKWYYRKKLEGDDFESELKMYAEDYVSTCLEAGEKFRLCYSLDALIKAHDELSIKNMLLLITAVKNNIPQEELPETIYIISDMEFDRGVNRDRTVFEDAKEKYEDYGYHLPNVVYWNVDSRHQQFPVDMNEKGVALVSGCSPTIFKMAMSQNVTPERFMLEILNGERYRRIVA